MIFSISIAQHKSFCATIEQVNESMEAAKSNTSTGELGKIDLIQHKKELEMMHADYYKNIEELRDILISYEKKKKVIKTDLRKMLRWLKYTYSRMRFK